MSDHLCEPGDGQRASELRTVGRWLLVALLVLAIAVVVVVVVMDDEDAAEPAGGNDRAEEPSDGTDTSADEPVTEFRGTGDFRTGSFEVAEGWEIRWESLGERIQMTLFTDAGQSRGVVVDRVGQGSGSTYPPGAGVFYLEVAADGEWSIRVFDSD